MDLLQSILLGIVQGLTEFLPVSSSGHLVIFEKIFQVEAHNLVFEVLVHFGTLVAVFIYFRKQLAGIITGFFKSPFDFSGASESSRNARLAWFIVLGTIPAAAIGMLLKDHIEIAFASPRWAAGMLLVTAAILIPTRWARAKEGRISIARMIIIGFAQALAIMPGISRSGTTISAGIFSGMNKSEAAEFSFLLSIPAILGATILEIPDFIEALGNATLVTNYLIGALVAAIVGYISIAFLMKVVKKGKFFYFGIYCAIVGLLGIFLL